MDDRYILNQLWNHTEAALQIVSENYGRRLYAIAYNILGDHGETEECLNDTYFALWNAIPPQRPHSLAAYACTVARNMALNRLREKRTDYDCSLDELRDCIADYGTQEALDVRQLGRAINDFLGTVPENSRSLFLRRYWFGDSVKRIAADFGMSENAVSVRLFRTRDKLKTYLIKEGYYEE